MTSKRASRRTVCIIRGVKELHQIKETNVVMWRDVLLQWRHKHTGPEKNKINEVTNSRLLCLNGKQCYEYCSCVYVYGYKYDINPVLLLGCVIQRNEYFLRKKKKPMPKTIALQPHETSTHQGIINGVQTFCFLLKKFPTCVFCYLFGFFAHEKHFGKASTWMQSTSVDYFDSSFSISWFCCSSLFLSTGNTAHPKRENWETQLGIANIFNIHLHVFLTIVPNISIL